MIGLPSSLLIVSFRRIVIRCRLVNFPISNFFWGFFDGFERKKRKILYPSLYDFPKSLHGFLRFALSIVNKSIKYIKYIKYSLIPENEICIPIFEICIPKNEFCLPKNKFCIPIHFLIFLIWIFVYLKNYYYLCVS